MVLTSCDVSMPSSSLPPTETSEPIYSLTNNFSYNDARLRSESIKRQNQENEGDIHCLSFTYSYAPKKEVSFELYYKKDVNGNISYLYVKEPASGAKQVLYDQTENPNAAPYELREDSFQVSLFSYHIIDIQNNEFTRWINIYDFITEDEVELLQKNRPSITKIQEINDIYFRLRNGDMVLLNQEFTDKIKNIIEKVTEDCFYDVETGRPTWAIYSNMYLVEHGVTHFLRVSLNGLIFDGVFYKFD